MNQPGLVIFLSAPVWGIVFIVHLYIKIIRDNHWISVSFASRLLLSQPSIPPVRVYAFMVFEFYSVHVHEKASVRHRW